MHVPLPPQRQITLDKLSCQNSLILLSYRYSRKADAAGLFQAIYFNSAVPKLFHKGPCGFSFFFFFVPTNFNQGAPLIQLIEDGDQLIQ